MPKNAAWAEGEAQMLSHKNPRQRHGKVAKRQNRRPCVRRILANAQSVAITAAAIAEVIRAIVSAIGH
jgi:hypothetical protein